VRSRTTGSEEPRVAARRLHFVGPWQSRPGHECTPFFGAACAARSRTRHGAPATRPGPQRLLGCDDEQVPRKRRAMI
jgi:hypothetical protein